MIRKMSEYETLTHQSISEDGVIHGVLLCGLESKNGYAYGQGAWGDEVRVKSLYEKRQVFLDHTATPDRPRSIKELAGEIIEAKIDEMGRPVGSIKTKGFPQGSLLESLYQANPGCGVGMSHVATCDFDKKNNRVKKVVDIHSVDVVMNPATTKSFAESTKPITGEAGMEELAKLQETVETSIRESAARNAKMETLAATVATLTESLAAVNAGLLNIKTSMEEQSRLRNAEKLVNEEFAKYPDAATNVHFKSADFVSEMLRLPVDQMQRLVKDRAVSLTPKYPMAVSQAGGSTNTWDDARSESFFSA